MPLQLREGERVVFEVKDGGLIRTEGFLPWGTKVNPLDHITTFADLHEGDRIIYSNKGWAKATRGVVVSSPPGLK